MTYKQETANLSSRERLILGALGGAVIAFATYPAMNTGYADLFLRPDWAEWVGLGLREAGAAGLGALWGHLHRPETNPIRAFQLGLAAPATLAGMIYANQSEGARPRGHVPAPHAVVAFVGEASGAATMFDVPLPPLLQQGERSIRERIIKGILGR